MVAGWSKPINDGSATTYGIEFGCLAADAHSSWQMPRYWNGAPTLRLNRSHIDAVKGPNNRLDYQTPVTAESWF